MNIHPKHKGLKNAWFKILLAASTTLVSYQAFAKDPCDVSGQLLIPRHQMLKCFKRVPFNPDLPEAISNAYEWARQSSDLIPYYRKSGKPLSVNADIDKIQQQILNTKAGNDFAFHQKIVVIPKQFKSSHWNYNIPVCYSNFLPLLPIELSSRLDNDQQVVYIKDNPFFAEEYEALTGINTDTMVGQTIHKIGNKKGLKAILNFARKNLGFSSFDGNLFSIALNFDEYNLIDSRRVPLPKNLNPKYILKDEDGKKTTVRIPWVFLNLAELRGGTSPSSTQEFVDSCQTPFDVFSYFGLTADSMIDGSFEKNIKEKMYPRAESQLNKKKKMVDRIRKKTKHFEKNQKAMRDKHRPLRFRLIEDNLEEGSVSYGQLGRRTTVIKIANFVPSNRQLFVDTVTNAVDHACQNSKNLMIDWSENGGGLVILSNYVVGLINPELSNGKGYVSQQPFPSNSRLIYSSYLEFEDLFSANYEPMGCEIGLTSQCWFRDSNDLPVESWASLDSSLEKRGKEKILLTERIYLDTFALGTGNDNGEGERLFDSIPQICPGKFTGRNFIQIINGAGGSGGAIAPGSIRDIGINVGYHGVKGKKLWFGFSQGGIVLSYHFYTSLLNDIIGLFFAPSMSLDEQLRALIFNEVLPVAAEYRSEGFGSLIDTVNDDGIFNDQVLLPDVRLDLWDDDAKDVFYTEALRAAKKYARENKIRKKK